MQDIRPPRRPTQGRRAPLERQRVVNYGRSESSITYTRQTRIIGDIMPAVKVQAEAPVKPPAPIIEKTETLVAEPVATTAPYAPHPERLSSDAKVIAMEQALRSARTSMKTERRKRRDLKRFGLVFMATIFVLATGYVSIDTWMTNQRVKAEANLVGDGTIGANWTIESEGQDETPRNSSSLDSYVVADSLPRALYISKLNVSARILPMGVGTNGAVQAPLNIFDAGWYSGSVKPGEAGAMFIDGHASGPTREGLFAYLDTMKKDDQLQVEKGDGTMLTYRVTHTETVPLDQIDMKKVLRPYGSASQGLNIMTCTGKWIEDKKTYDQRVIVYTEQI